MATGNFLKDIATFLQTNGIGTLGTNLFYSYMPKSPDSLVAVLDGSGTTPDPYLPTQEPPLNIMVRSAEFDAGDLVASNIRALLHAITPQQIGTSFVYFALLQTEVNHLGRDEVGRDIFSLTFRCRVR